MSQSIMRETALARYINEPKFRAACHAIIAIGRAAKMEREDFLQAASLVEQVALDVATARRECGCLADLPHVEGCALVETALMANGEFFQDVKGNLVDPPIVAGPALRHGTYADETEELLAAYAEECRQALGELTGDALAGNQLVCQKMIRELEIEIEVGRQLLIEQAAEKGEELPSPIMLPSKAPETPDERS